ncbi:hypothetical protein CLV46_0445 [Diaminobutyricimonas aerilata]|uniref:Uncharacterized protein n=1 Tax=Diaminobutyricimonas aerilata TaxID=1162967 RepID=A0A2M9CG53_9MICO|nr:hypothetical protein [Diaminobutyricimonas aerilata]PJJ70916.1 hypothetical protein CLV46_0445 [Diaminobutyricimonas aerilata]
MNDQRDPGGAVPATPPPAAASAPSPAPDPAPVPEPVGGPTPTAPASATEPAPVPEPVEGTTPADSPRPRNRVLGITTFVLALLLLAGNIVGIVLSNDPATFVVATGIAYVVIFGSLVTFLMGAVAAVANLGRGWGFGAMAVSFVANPFVMLSVLNLFSGVGA